jgi:uncharacterized lipoprotein YddW (UPF0748 family)
MKCIGVLAMAGSLSACAMAGVPVQAPEPIGAEVPAPVAQPERRPPDPRIVRPEPDGPARRFEEVRGLWVVRTSLKTPESVRAMVADAWAGGFNTVIVQVRGRGDAFYDSRWEPPGEQLWEAPAGFDPLALAIQEAHARGMAVHAWVNTHLIWSGEALPVSPEHVVNANPEWLAVPRALGRELYDVAPADSGFVRSLRRYAADHADRVEGVYTSPSHPGVKGRVYDVWIDLATRYDLDGIHFDYVRFPSLDFDYSRGALDRFESWVAPRLGPELLGTLQRAVTDDPFAFVDSLPDAWGEFRRAQITQLVETVYYGVKARRPDLVVSAAVFPNLDDAYDNRFQEWARWLERGIVDVVVPMAYTEDDENFQRLMRDAMGVAGGSDRLWAGIGAYVNSVDGVVGQIGIARREGAGGVMLFSYDWARDEGGLRAGVPYLERVGRAVFISPR